MILNYINIKILVCLHVLNVQLTTSIPYFNVAHIISRFPQPYLFAGHTAESLFMVTVLSFAWKNFVSSKISKNFIALCTTYIFDVFRKSECNRFVSERVNPVATQNSSLQNTCFVSYKT